jgi:antitoxin MazE
MYIHQRRFTMTVAVRRWGNSLALRIPKDIATTLLIEDNSLVELTVEEKTLTIKPTTTHTYLEELVSQITPQNLHHEVDTGRSVGNEEW